MFHGSSSFIRFGSPRQWADRTWWLVFGPGVALMLLALAIIVWPQLLAYLVAGAIFFAGLTLAGWGLALRRATRTQNRQGNAVYYEVS